MRVLRLLVACLFLAAGALLGALNPQSVTIDFGPASVNAGLGISLLAALLVGVAACGLLLSTLVIVPMKLRLRRLQVDSPAGEKT
ncbi:LapA family protein [Pseudoluteimonas lycopersici]|uniref:LapA family protein n=1 Tax=Pseudoluteimonas lycopersici TaxID=1324796 RepID=A0A516V355_9GAMM|nr:LapA family protein [Lysobacter lycopersici]QDQ72937.1 LapA family protein [Lysobacter lycopersici]